MQKTLPSITISANMTLDHFGLPSLSQEIVVGFIGKGARVLAESVMRHSGIDDPDTIEEAFRIYTRIFDEHCTDELEPYDGVPEMFDRLLGMGVDVAVVTNKNMSMAPRVLATSFLWISFPRFAVIVPISLSSLTHLKRLMCLRNLGLRPNGHFSLATATSM